MKVRLFTMDIPGRWIVLAVAAFALYAGGRWFGGPTGIGPRTGLCANGTKRISSR
jgi:hypothetical protein